jgi:hypothetical protein
MLLAATARARIGFSTSLDRGEHIRGPGSNLCGVTLRRVS